MAVQAVAKKSATNLNRSGVSALQTFAWSGTDKRGVKLRGDELAKNENLVRAELRKRGITPSTVKVKKDSFFSGSGGTVKARDIAMVARQLATMMQAGVPLVQTFEILASGSSNPSLKKLLNAIKTEIEGGSSLSEALGKHPAQFDELFVNLTRAGETAGVLDTILDTVATYKENIETIKQALRNGVKAIPVCYLIHTGQWQSFLINNK